MRAAEPSAAEPSAATLDAFLLAGDTRSQAWIKTLLQEELPAQAYGRQLLQPGAQAPAALAQATSGAGSQVCTCFNVSQPAIEQHLQRCMGLATERLASLQSALQCGTNCGSCLPQLRQLVAATGALPEVAL